MKVLVTAATKHGATAEIAAAIGEVLGGGPGLDAAAIPPEQVATIDGDDAVVLGSAVYAGHWLAAAKELVDRAGDALAGKPVWLFSSGPSWFRCGSRKGTSGTGPRSRAGRRRSPTPCGPAPDPPAKDRAGTPSRWHRRDGRGTREAHRLDPLHECRPCGRS